MKKNLFLGLSFLLISNSGLSGCSANNPATISGDSLKSTSTVGLKSAGKVFNIGLAQKGASISFKLNLNDLKFKTKSANGQAPKTIADVDHFLVYLVKNATTPYPVTGDPISDAVDIDGTPGITDADAFTLAATDNYVTFTNVPTGQNYYIAIRAIEKVTGLDIIDQNNHGVPDASINWSGTTNGTPYFDRVAVSDADPTDGQSDMDGVAVDGAFAITYVDNTATTQSFDGKDMLLDVHLDDASGATLTADVQVTAGTAGSIAQDGSDITIQ